jgi:kynurenine formamidase
MCVTSLHRHDEGVSRRGFLKAGAAAALGAAVTVAGPAAPVMAARGRPDRIRDLTHVFVEGFPMYAGPNPVAETLTTFEDDGFYSQLWTFAEHSGTHVDVPGHFVEGNRLAHELTPDELMAPLAVIDISDRAAVDPDAAVTVADIRGYERRHGRIPRGALVCEYSGWEVRVGDEDAYRNTGPDGLFHFPGFSGEAVEFLLDRRQITGIGVDTLSLDIGASTTFDVHVMLLGADHFGVENMANLNEVPPRGATVFVGLVPWENGSGGPCRAIATW